MTLEVIGIDPGTTESAYAIWDGSKIIAFGKIPNEQVLSLEVLGRTVYMECIAGYGMQVGQEVFETCRWEGKFEYVLSERTDVKRIKRRDVKDHICLNARANDSAVNQALTDRIGPKGTKAAPGPTYGVSKDVWAALAIAVTGYDKERA